MKNKTILTLLLSLSVLSSFSQKGEYIYDDATQLWRLTQNAAGLYLDSTANRGYSEAGLTHRSGDYSRVQEGNVFNGLSFYTERYQSIGKNLKGYGRFRFDMGRCKNRAWADVMRPFEATPFINGSSVKGRYDTQQFDLSAALATAEMSGWHFGARLDYKVADLSRLRDPRSRSEMLDYRFTPSATLSLTEHSAIGLAAHYERRKEKIPNISTVQEDPNLYYYQMSGLEQVTGTVGGYKGFSREWVDNRFGGEFSLYYKDCRSSSLATLSLERGTEDVLETYKREPGKYYSYLFKVNLRNRLYSERLVHKIDASLAYEQDYADQYRQNLVQERDAEHGYTTYRYETLIKFKKRYQSRFLHLDADYRANFTVNHTVNSYIGGSIDVQQAHLKHLLPSSSFNYGSTSFLLSGGFSQLGGHVWLEGLVQRHLAHDVELNLANPETEYAQSVLVHDYAYYDTNYWRFRMQLTYQFPLNIKGQTTRWFARLWGEETATPKSFDGNATFVGLSVGLYN